MEWKAIEIALDWPYTKPHIPLPAPHTPTQGDQTGLNAVHAQWCDVNV